MMEAIISENIVQQIMGLSMVVGLLLGVFLTLAFLYLFELIEEKKKARKRLLCQPCLKRTEQFEIMHK